MHRLPRIVFVTPTYGSDATGPETFARYLWENFGADPHFEFHLVAATFPETHPRWHESGLGTSSLDLYQRLAGKALHVADMLAAEGGWPILHVNNSNLHRSLLNYPGVLWGQVNDYENVDLWRRAGETIRCSGWRRFFSLVRRRRLERRFLNRQDLSLCNSHFTREKVLSEYHPSHPERVITLYKAVDTRFYERPGVLPDDPIVRPTSARKFVFVGSDIRRKGLDTLLRATLELPPALDWHLTIVGVGKAAAKATFPDLPPFDDSRVHFAGVLERKRLREVLWRSDVFVLPSRAEALGVAVLEALAAGLPVVASNVGGIPEIIRDPAAGVLASPDDPSALALAMAKTKPWPEGPPGVVKEIVNSFSTAVMFARLRELYLQNS